MCDDDAGKHSERVDRRVAYRRFISWNNVVGIVQCHRVGHTSAEHTACIAEVHFAQTKGYQSHDNDRNKGYQESDAYPQGSFRTHDGFKEVRTGIQSKTSQVKRQADTSEHQIGTARGIGHQMQTRPVGSNQDTDYNRSACQS